MVKSLYEGTIPKPRNTKINVGDTTYQLRQHVDFKYTRWDGAGAALFIDDPINPKITTSFGPVLVGPQDILESVDEVLSSKARRYHALAKIGVREEKDQREFDKLGRLIKAA